MCSFKTSGALLSEQKELHLRLLEDIIDSALRIKMLRDIDEVKCGGTFQQNCKPNSCGLAQKIVRVNRGA